MPTRELDSGAHPGHGAGVVVAGDPADERVVGKRAGSKVEDGIDTFAFGDGLIRVPTVRYTLRRT